MVIKDIIKKLPDATGVYLMKDKNGVVLYVGKATSLKKRVSSYFRKNANLGFKDNLVREVDNIEYVLCETEAKALILEASLIKEYKTKYNVLLRDDKSFPYVQISNDEFPCLSIVRKKKDKKAKYFGPYLNANSIKEALEVIRKIFPYRSCKSIPERPCLYHHIGLCKAPCVGNISVQDYAQTIQMISYVLDGQKNLLVDFLKSAMKGAADEMNFEKAAYFRDKLEAVSMLYGVRREFKELLSLQKVLGMSKIPVRIECVDISGIQFTDTCGSLVVFENGVPKKKDYRRYKIKEQSNDDFRMVEEVVYRRLSRLKREKKILPDLLVIDGGQMQVEFAVQARDRVGLDIAIIGLAKKNEEIWQEKLQNPLRLSRSDPALKLIQRLRDEAHRFVNSYHQKLRHKRMFGDKK